MLTSNNGGRKKGGVCFIEGPHPAELLRSSSVKPSYSHKVRDKLAIKDFSLGGGPSSKVLTLATQPPLLIHDSQNWAYLVAGISSNLLAWGLPVAS